MVKFKTVEEFPDSLIAKKKILVLGGSGYIGSKFIEQFALKYDLSSIDLQLFHKDNYSIPINYNKVLINEYDIIICFAAHSSVQMCEHSPSRSWINNVEYFKNSCDKLSNKQTLIYMSSASIYGNSNNVSTENDINLNPIQNYDLHKTIIDLIANKYIGNKKNIVGLRLGTVNGSSPHTRKELMLNSMVTNAIDTKFIRIKNLNMKRSILGINDLMRAIDSIINKGCDSGQYNLCSFTSNVQQLGSLVSSVCDAKIIEDPSDNICYNFEISTEKFTKIMNFSFEDTPLTIIKGLVQNHNTTKYSTRTDDAKFYEYM